MKTSTIIPIMLCAAAAAMGQVTNVIRFDPPSLPGGSCLLDEWTESGFRFRASSAKGLGHTDSMPLALYPNNGSAYLRAGGKMLISRSSVTDPSDAIFSVQSVDLAEYSTLFATPSEATFTGIRSDGSSVTQTFLLDGVMDGTGPAVDFQTFQFSSGFTNLVLLVASPGSWHMDNLMVQTSDRAEILPGMVSWWRAEGNTADSWGTNHGSATAKFEPGMVGQCFTAASETRVAHSASLQLTNALTIEAWVNPEPYPQGVTYRSVVSKFAFSQFTSLRAGSYFFGLGYGNYPNGPVFMLTPSGFESNAVRLAPFTNLPSGKWSHLAATYDGAVMKLYLNGSLLGQSNYSGGIWPGTNDLGIGSTPVPGVGRSSYRINGRIDEPTLYRRALSATEIAAIYAAGSSGKSVRSCVPSPAGLISWWPGDSNVVDVLGSNSLAGTPQFASGQAGQAFRFSGGHPVLFVPVAPTLNFASNADFSIEMWIKANSNLTQAKMPLVEKRYEIGVPENPQPAGYALSLNYGKLALWLRSISPADSGEQFLSQGADLRDGRFHHVGVSVNRDVTNGGKLYVDGQVVLTFNPVPHIGSLSSSSPFYIARPTALSPGGYFDGLIDEPAIYGRALGEDEMRAIYAAGGGGKCKAPPFMLVQPAGGRFVPGTPVTLIGLAGGSPNLRYQWHRNGATIPLATRESFTFPASASTAGNYFVRVTNSFGVVTSSIVTVALNQPPTPVVRVLTRFLTVSNDTDIRVIATTNNAAHVIFDASLTRDPDDDPLTFAWWRGDGGIFATSPVASAILPIGSHDVRLTVSDGYVTVTNEFTLEIITGADAVELLANLVADSDLPHGRSQPLHARLRSAKHAFDVEHAASGVHHLEMIQMHIRQWIAPDSPELAAQWVWIAQEIIDAFSVTEVVDARSVRAEVREHGHRAVQFKGAKGRPYLVEASGDLVNWQVIGAAVEGAPGEFEFDDPAGSTATQRFYRIRKP